MCTDRLTCACATHVNPEGEGVKRDLMTYGITKKPLQIIGNGSICGVDMAYFDRTEAVMKQAVAYREEGCFTFCFVGRIVRDKGINELVSAFVRLHQQYPQVRLLLVGPFESKVDPVLPETEKAIQEHPAIRFMGFVLSWWLRMPWCCPVTAKVSRMWCYRRERWAYLPLSRISTEAMKSFFLTRMGWSFLQKTKRRFTGRWKTSCFIRKR
jgi:glycosyltransferase involved in cell wall biosynthesis